MTSLLAVLASAAAYVTLFAPYALHELAFVALAPLAFVLRSARVPAAAGWLGLWAMLATAGILAWVVPTARDYFGISQSGAIGLLALIALLSAAPQLALVGALLGARRFRSQAAWPLLFALAWVAGEWLRTHTGMESPWTRLGDSQHDSPRLRQIADLSGVYGVSFLLALGNALVAEAARALLRARAGSRIDLSQLKVPTSVFVVSMICALLYGQQRNDEWSSDPALLDVVLIQGSVPQEVRWSRTRSSQVMRRYMRLTREALRESGPAAPDLVVWPENAIQTSLEDPVYGPAMRRLPQDLDLPLLIGAPRSESSDGGTRRYNSAFLLEPDGAVEHYDKRRLLLFSERSTLAVTETGSAPAAPAYTAGETPGLFDLGGLRLGALICMEALYPSLAREAARAGASILVNLSNDGWFRGAGAGRQHLAQVRFRAIETRLPLLRATTSGVTAVIGPDGRIDARLEPLEQGWLRTAVRRGKTTPTLYTHFGDAVPLAALVICVFAACPWKRKLPDGDSPHDLSV